MPLRQEEQESINKQWDSIQSKMDELQELRKKLNCSLAIQSLWPEAFKLGPVKTYFVGNLYKIREMRFKIEAGDDDAEYSLFEIPEILLDRQIELQIEKADSMVNREIWVKFKNEVYDHKRRLTLGK
jgi:hypothetical protein